MSLIKNIGGIEGGGTKFNLIISEVDEGLPGTIPKVIVAGQIPTTTPVETLNNVIDFFQSQKNYPIN